MSVVDDIERDMRVLFEKYMGRAIVVAFVQEVDVDGAAGGPTETFVNHDNAMAILNEPKTLAYISAEAERQDRSRPRRGSH